MASPSSGDTFFACLTLALILSVPQLRGAEPQAERIDAFGDPLPAEVVWSIGSIHFRRGDTIRTLISIVT